MEPIFSWREMHRKTCAVFDLDGTILSTSSERVFFTEMILHGEIPRRNLARWSIDLLKFRSLRLAKANKIYLRGFNFDHLKNLARNVVETRLIADISPRVYELISWHRSEKRMIFILSGSLEILIGEIGEHLKVDQIIGNVLEVIDGEVTGNRISLNPYGENKATIAKLISEKYDLDLSRSYVYGNHRSDHHKLRLFGHPVAVNPDPGLRRIAQQNGWKIEIFHGN